MIQVFVNAAVVGGSAGEGANLVARGHWTNWSSGSDHNQLLYESSLEVDLGGTGWFDCRKTAR